jgi:hypothetical protein
LAVIFPVSKTVPAVKPPDPSAIDDTVPVEFAPFIVMVFLPPPMRIEPVLAAFVPFPILIVWVLEAPLPIEIVPEGVDPFPIPIVEEAVFPFAILTAALRAASVPIVIGQLSTLPMSSAAFD